MEFLVRMVTQWPPGIDPKEVERLREAERRRARELAAAGVLRRLWRVPGQRANWGLWEAPDATALHAAISSLPLFPLLEVEVYPLADHPSDPAARSDRNAPSGY